MYKGVATVVAVLALCGCGLIPEKKPVTQMTDAEFRNNYTCPEYLSTSGKNKEITDLLAWAQARHPDWNTQQALVFRQQMLENHHCMTEHKGGL